MMMRYNKYNKRKIQCINCDVFGHTLKNCNLPILSCGIICFKNCLNDPKYLLIQKKDSMCFVEFMRGKYQLTNVKYICTLFRYITSQEKSLIVNYDFDTIWNEIWKDFDKGNYVKDYHHAKEKFNKIKNGYYLNDKNKNPIYITLQYILDKSQHTEIPPNTYNMYDEREWEFPKGRRNINEEALHTALREFEEETGIKESDICFLNNKKYEEIFTGLNGVCYKNIYYIAQLRGDCKCGCNAEDLLDKDNKHQLREVRDVKWFDYNDVCARIRDINQERKKVFQKVHKIILRGITISV